MGQPVWADAETELEPGRYRVGADELPETVLEDGRSRQGVGVPVTPVGPPAFPAELAARFDLERVLRPHVVGSPKAEVFLVCERATGEHRVIKVHRTGPGPAAGVLTVLAGAHSDHIVRVCEHSAPTTSAPAYEVMEYVPGPTLAEFLARLPADARVRPAPQITQIVYQLAVALTDLGRHRLAHLDLKPANIIVRREDPIELVIIDFGISVIIPQGRDRLLSDAPAGTPQYLPPEWMEEASLPRDYWSLGMIVWELAMGRPHFRSGLDTDTIRRSLTLRDRDVAGISDPRLRRLCRGLLTRTPERRWGREEVGQWLAGGEPTIADEPPPGQGPGAGRAFVFDGVAHVGRRHLAVHLAREWDLAARDLFGPDGRLNELRAWLALFADPHGAHVRQRIDELAAALAPLPDSGRPPMPHDVALLHVIRAIAPALPPTYRNRPIDSVGLAQVADQARGGDRSALSIVRDLWQHRLLRAFAPVDDRGELAEIQRVWVALHREWRLRENELAHAPAREVIAGLRRDGRLVAAELGAAARGTVADARLRDQINRTQRFIDATVPPGGRHPAWFFDIAHRPELLWITFLLMPLVRQEAQAEQLRVQLEIDELRRLVDGHEGYEWGRRQARPTALAWAVAGVTALAALWVALFVLGDMPDWADDTTMRRAWVAAAGCLGLSLVAESLLAVDAAGRYHPDYSMFGSIAQILARPAQWVQGRGRAGMVIILGILLGVYLVAAIQPVVIPVVMSVGHLAWAVMRQLRWRADYQAQEQRIQQQAQHDRQAHQGVHAPG